MCISPAMTQQVNQASPAAQSNARALKWMGLAIISGQGNQGARSQLQTMRHP